MYDSVRTGFMDFITPFEGRVRHLYQDTKGLVTVGVGNLVDDESPGGSGPGLAQALPFVQHLNGDPDQDGELASDEQIAGDWKRIKEDTSLAEGGWPAARPLTTVHLTDLDIDDLVAARLGQFENTLRDTEEFAGLDDWPADAQMALLSMAWAMGPGFATGGRWPGFRKAVANGNWLDAAAESHISNGAPARNAADEQLFRNAQRVVDQGLDPSMLLYSPPPPTVRKGSTGAAVTRLQQRLAELGYSCPVTGVFEDETDAAVRSFQLANGLGADGIVGPRTWAALGF